MEDPVIAEDGQTYEREAIATWVAGHGTSPMTRQRMANTFFPNRTVKGMIERWTQESG
jgi:hemolysin-activating ACP:hemolysin acyltransferase